MLQASTAVKEKTKLQKLRKDTLKAEEKKLFPEVMKFGISDDKNPNDVHDIAQFGHFPLKLCLEIVCTLEFWLLLDILAPETLQWAFKHSSTA